MLRLNYFINLLNLFLIFIYFLFINIKKVKKEFEFLLIALILINLIIKLFNWYNFENSQKIYLNNFINNIFFSEKFTKISIFILSSIIPAYMIIQKDSLIVDLLIEKISFLFVFIFSILGFYLEFFVLKIGLKK